MVRQIVAYLIRVQACEAILVIFSDVWGHYDHVIVLSKCFKLDAAMSFVSDEGESIRTRISFNVSNASTTDSLGTVKSKTFGVFHNSQK